MIPFLNHHELSTLNRDEFMMNALNRMNNSTPLIEPKNFDTIEHMCRFQRVVKFQQFMNVADATSIRKEFIELSKMAYTICIDDDDYTLFDYSNLQLILDDMFGSRIIQFETGLTLTDLRIVMPCIYKHFHRGVSGSVIDHLMGIADCPDCLMLYGPPSCYPT